MWADRKPCLGRDPDNPGKKQVFILNPDAENFVWLFTLSQGIESQDNVSQVVSDFMYFRWFCSISNSLSPPLPPRGWGTFHLLYPLGTGRREPIWGGT